LGEFIWDVIQLGPVLFSTKIVLMIFCVIGVFRREADDGISDEVNNTSSAFVLHKF